MSLLYYWRPDNYGRDRRFGFGYHLNQNSPQLASARPGDSLWAFTRRKRDGLYVLAAELVVRALTRNPPNYRYGRYRIWGELAATRYFDLDIAPSVDLLIRSLHIRAQGEHLGQAFQGHAAVRALTEADHLMLTGFSRNLPTLGRVRIYPEDEFEARLIQGNDARPLVLREEASAYGERLQYLYESVDVHRARRHVERLQELYTG
jgi:5-methylcytosine-specific restriction enzyme A